MTDLQLFQEALAIHFDERWGTPYWLDVQRRLGFRVVDEVHSPEDLHLLGPMEQDALRSHPLESLISRASLPRRPGMILAETGGTTGAPNRRVYLSEEFTCAFAAPWERAAELRGFPRGATWLWLGPSGPHVIHQAARAMARRVGSLEPFSVDCDVRWLRRQAAGSLGHRLYMDHVLAQAMDVVRTQEIGVLFTTPPLLERLAEKMTDAERERIRGVHLGGLPVDGAFCRKARTELFPRAVVLPGYGNSLFGVAFEPLAPLEDHAPRYVVDDPHLWLQVAPADPLDPDRVDLRRTVGPGERGRVVVHRWDRSFLLLNWVERDLATHTPPVAGGPFAGRMGLMDVGSAEERRSAHLAVVY